MLGNGLHLLGITLQFGIMSHSGLCHIGDYVAIVAFGIMSIWHYVTFGIMSHLALLYVAFGIMLHSGLRRSVLCHSGLCRIRHSVAFGLTLFGIVSFGNVLFGVM